ncbi:MAG: hypothetical protein M1840_002409 [Geoglossum simile]|nr:MAG: hypothetical protein M1840_002409 [Geoglossum simile]
MAYFAASTPELAATIAETKACLPAAHRMRPIQDEVVSNLDTGIERIQNCAFCEHFAVAVSSRSANRVRLRCVHHHTETRNTRKTELKARKRVETSTQTMSCKFEIHIRQLKRRGEVWAIGWSPHQEHSHGPNPDPPRYTQHCHRRPGNTAAVVLATAHRGELTYNQSARILTKEGLHLDSKEYYDLQRKRDSGRALTKEEQLELLFHPLEVRDFRVRTREEYLIDNEGKRTARIARDIFIWSSEQIRLARRFVSEFIWETDATFNTNDLKMPLSILVGITNTGQTFPVAFVFIHVESVEMFRWVHEQLTKLIFYVCPLPHAVAGDFAAGLPAAMATTKEQVAFRIIEKKEGEKANEEETEAVAKVRQQMTSREIGNCFLQICEWHAVQAIRKRLTITGGYPGEWKDLIIDLVWSWIKSPTEKDLKERREQLLAAVDVKEATGLNEFYRTKESQFIYVYTSKQANLGVRSTQWSESYHKVVK